MSNISSLFENLMTYSESTSKRPAMNKKGLKESEQTVLNLAVELPNNVDEIEPDDVNVEVGVMVLDSDDTQSDEPVEDEIDIVEEPEDEPDNKKDKEDKAEESIDVDAAKKRIMKRAGVKTEAKEDCDDPECAKKAKSAIIKGKAKTEGKGVLSRDILKNKKTTKTEANLNEPLKPNLITALSDLGYTPVDKVPTEEGRHDLTVEDENHKKFTVRVLIKKDGTFNILDNQIYPVKESLAHLDVNSLNKLITEFVRANYKNIDKVTFNKAILESNKLTLKGIISDKTGKKEAITFVNRGFDAKKLENKAFLIDFKDMGRTFNVVKESLKQPFTFKATMKNGVVKFESLKVNFRTRIDESKTVQVTGAYALTETATKKKR